MQLNKQQELAVSHYLGPCIVTAVPGSGKTRVLTSRVVSLIRDKGINPKNILCLTFTNKAANEMKERILHELSEDSADASLVWISTFHKLCLAILRKFGNQVDLAPGFSIYSAKEQEDLMLKIARMHEYEASSKYAVQGLIKTVNDFREDVTNFKQHLVGLTSTEAEIISEYQDTLNNLNAVDFSGMLYKAWVLFKNNPAIVEKLAERFKFVLVDEMQDTNHIQYEIVRGIAQHSNLFVVGDYQQSIYGWRGAKPENLNKFKKDFVDVNEVILPRNYRSTTPILQAAQKLIRNNYDAEDVELHSDRGSGPDVRIRCHYDPERESETIVHDIQALHHAYDYQWKDFAVLYRMNSLSRSPEISLRSNGVPYKILGGFSFFERMEIKTALSYLTLFVNPHDTINFARAITHPKRGVGTDTIGKIERLCGHAGTPILEAITQTDQIPKMTTKAKTNLKSFAELFAKYKQEEENLSLSELTEGLLKESGFWEYIKTIPEKEIVDKSRFENLEEFLSGVVEYQNRRPSATLADYLQSIQLLANDISNEDENEDAVRLLTMHSAKGLEWPCVHIVGAERGCIPHSRAERERGDAEERRLMYVAMTRARDYLSISYCETRRGRLAGRSRFLDEIE